MFSDGVCSHRTERAGADVQRHFFNRVTLFFQFGYQRFGEV